MFLLKKAPSRAWFRVVIHGGGAGAAKKILTAEIAEKRRENTRQ
jgi:hypothetical protein